MKRFSLSHGILAALFIAALGAISLTRPSYPGAPVPASVATSLRGGNCPNVAALTCQGSGVHGDGSTCPAGSIIVAGNQWSCNPTGNGYCCGISSCWTCYTGWITCIK